MSISINWITGVIFVPRADMTLIQSNPVEIRQHDTNAFRFELRDKGDDVEGRPWPKTHNHNEDVSVGGIELADVLLILEPYTITYEDGQYAVYLQGTNNNILERTNKNQVSINPSNSAGLVNSSAIEFSEYANGVNIDEANITGNAVSGTIYPAGSLRAPCLDIDNAIAIANYRGVHFLNIIGDADFGAGHNIDGFCVRASSHVQSEITIASLAGAEKVVITELTVSGTLDGDTDIKNCITKVIHFFNGHIHNSALGGTITLGGGVDCSLIDCHMYRHSVIPIIDMGGSGQNLYADEYGGAIKITNLTGVNNTVNIGLSYGKVILDSATVTAGEVSVNGYGLLIDELGNYIYTGTWNGVTIINNASGILISDISHTEKWIYIDTEAAVNGDGKSGTPFNNVSDAVDYGEYRGWYKLMFVSDATLERTLKNFTIKGVGLPTIDFNGQNVDRSEFMKVKLTGHQVGSITAREVMLLDGMTGLNGVYKEFGLAGNVTCADNSIISMAQMSTIFITSHVHYAIDMGAGNTNVKLNIRKLSGAIKIQNCNHADKLATVAFSSGHIELDNTNIAGEIGIAGIPDSAIIDNSGAGCNVPKSGVFPSVDTIMGYNRDA